MRKKLMGGGMLGRRMGYSEGTKPISRSKNPGLLAMSKTAKGKEAVKKMKFNPNRIVAKNGTSPEQFMKSKSKEDLMKNPVKFKRSRELMLEDLKKSKLKRRKP